MRLKKTLKYFFFEYLVALCLSFRKYSILNLPIVTLRDTILQTYLVEKHKLEPILAPVVQTMDSAIRRINHYPLDSAIDFAMTYPLDSICPADNAIHRLNNWPLDSGVWSLDSGLCVYVT